MGTQWSARYSRKGYQRSSGGCIWAPEAQYIPNTPSRWLLTSPHMGGIPFSRIPCTPLGAPGIHRFGPLWPKMAKNRPKGGYPPHGHFFRKVAESQTPFSPIFEKCGFPPPAGPSFGGGESALFFENRRKQGLNFCYLPKTVFLEGGPLTPVVLCGVHFE